MKKISLILVAFTLLVGFSCKQKDEKKEETTTTTTLEKKESDLRYSMEFTAFKTPEKVGVKGTFDDIKLQNTKSGNITETLEGATFEIATASINSKDPTRDIKLKQFFFDQLENQTISGQFKSFNDGKAIIAIQMNNVEKDIPFEYNATESEVLLSGTIDMISDFSANKAFDAIHEACKILHEDKTWTDVNINITVGK